MGHVCSDLCLMTAWENSVSVSAAAPPRASAEALFKVKPAWRLAELEPYLEGIVGPDKKGEAVVLQHARCVTASDGSRSYVART